MIHKIKLSVLVTAFLTVSSLTLVAQKNKIFRGGTGDGYARASSSYSSSSIYKGGNGDGWAYAKYLPITTSNIFKGGTGDGWSFKNYLPTTNSFSIAKGGAGDGWSFKNSNIPVASNIYKGGLGDGWARQDLLPSPLGTDVITFVEDEQIMLEEYTASDVQLYPSPAQNVLNLRPLGKAFKNESYTVKILSSSGCVMISEKAEWNDGSDARIDISGLASGQYFVQTYSSSESYIKPLLIIK
jgi:hypothetical protein